MVTAVLIQRRKDLWRKYSRREDKDFTVCLYRRNGVLILIMRWPEVCGGRACLGVIGFLGKGFVGLIGHIFLSPGQKTWYLNYALYGRFDATLTLFAL